MPPYGDFTPRVRWLIIARDSTADGTPTCQWCGRPVAVYPGRYSIQHRRARGLGGSRLRDTREPQNGVLVHGTGTTECHGYIEQHPTEAAERGFRVAQHANPLRVPLITVDGARWQLTVRGERFVWKDDESEHADP